ncbi:hypothetical protein H7J07_04690 [Mycobacterium koreense]|uniref:Transposase n=1 Tax=Mycolicibacillus koreensis TaxID=1069220 RepID=A0AA91SSC5_9MYCO|nr:hypothetical protein [Mycolicibacillus koreensis]MCV7247554.1 hypothetical protein [Mycolicibacillus koreensis]OSC34611.1 hypothetical protein B8W67_06480 [Mycolicibacillus koreensis]
MRALEDVTYADIDWGRTPTTHHGVTLSGVRRIAQIAGVSWPHEPETCGAGPLETVWVCGGQVLLCRGCGLDAT